MTIHRVLTTALLLGMGFMGSLSVSQGIQAANAQSQTPEQRSVLANKEGRGANGGGPRGQRLARICEGDGIEGHIEKMSEVIEELELTNSQEQYWEDVVATSEDIDVEDACTSGDRAEIREVMQDMRESMQTFFESLSDEQREELRALKPERPEGNRPLNRQGQGERSGQRSSQR